MEKNYYDILQINKNATPEIVEKAYKTLVRMYHPDLQEGANKQEYEEKLNSAKEQGQEIIKQATLRAEQKENEIIANAKQEASQIKEKASKDVEQERQKVMNEIKSEISNIALLAASKVIEKDIDSNKHKELIDNFIKEVGESK